MTVKACSTISAHDLGDSDVDLETKPNASVSDHLPQDDTIVRSQGQHCIPANIFHISRWICVT
jgi:hypothetical protein